MQPSPTPRRIDPARRARDGVLDLNAYVPGKPIAQVKREYGLERVVKLASNECPLAPPEPVVRAIQAHIADLCRYPDGHCSQLRQCVALRDGVPVESLLFGNGAEECIRLIGQAFLEAGDTAVIASPIFDAYDTITRMQGAAVLRVPLRDFHIDLSAIADAVSSRCKIVWLCSPTNPSGTVVRRQEMDRFLERLPDDVLVVLDEAYFEFVTDPRAVHAADYLFADDRVVGIRTFSKAYGLAGLRVGYITAHPEIIRIVSMVKLPFNVNQLAQAAALGSLEANGFVEEHVRMIDEERWFLTTALTRRGMEVIPSQANFLLVKTPLDSDRLFRVLLPKGVIIRPGSIWELPRHIRLSVGTHPENVRFLEAFDEVLRECRMDKSIRQ